jgi:hypothetical protein
MNATGNKIFFNIRYKQNEKSVSYNVLMCKLERSPRIMAASLFCMIENCFFQRCLANDKNEGNVPTFLLLKVHDKSLLPVVDDISK